MSKNSELQHLKSECENCKKCSLCETRTNTVFSDGDCDAKIFLIGEAPGADEDKQGKPFVGRAGKLLNEFLENAGISRQSDIYICNTIKCRPPMNRIPMPHEKSACLNYLLKQIELVNPKVIVLCGATAANTFIETKEKISQLRGKWFKVLGNREATVIFHPSYLLRNHSTEVNSPRWFMQKDLLAIVEKTNNTDKIEEKL